jgi:hypothetical protein
MSNFVPGIDKVSFIGHSFRLSPEFGYKREGIQIYTLAILGVILKEVCKIMHNNGMLINLTYEIVPFDNEVRDVLTLDVGTCDNIGDIIIHIIH